MDVMEAIKERNSVRSYTDKKIEGEVKKSLEDEIMACNQDGGLNIQLITEEPNAFDSFLAHYGKFSGVNNYIALIGKKGSELEEKVGYYGERIALKAQQLGLNTCWVALTFNKKKSKCVVQSDEKLVCVLALGYGTTSGTPHKSKPLESLCKYEGEAPDWFNRGMEAVVLAPTATNQQKFRLTGAEKKVKAEATGGFYSKVDLGIVKYHFEAGAGTENFKWNSNY